MDHISHVYCKGNVQINAYHLWQHDNSCKHIVLTNGVSRPDCFHQHWFGFIESNVGCPTSSWSSEFLSPELNMPLPFSSLIWWETATKFGLPAWTWRKHSTDLSFCLVCCVGTATCATSAWQIFNLNKHAPYSHTEFITTYCVVWNNDMCWTHCVLMLGWNSLCRNGHHVWQPQAHG